MMTGEEIAAEYLRRESDGNKKVAGADPAAILRDMARELNVDVAHVRAAVLDHTLMGPG